MSVAIVTGSNKGIGLGIVRALCLKFNGDVYLTSRNHDKGLKAVQLLQQEGLDPKYHQLDIDNQDSILNIRDLMKERYGGINVLVNNAGIVFKNEANALINNAGVAFKNEARESFGSQAAATVGTNYFSNKNTCDLLFPLLKPGARVVNMSSSAGFLGLIGKWSKCPPPLDCLPTLADPTRAAKLKHKLGSSNLTVEQLDELMREFVKTAQEGRHGDHGWINSAYCASKIGFSALTRIQQRMMESDPRPDIAVNHVHPGFVATDMTNHNGPFNIDRGAESAVFAALLPPGTRTKGAYIWHDCQVVDWVNGPTPPGTRASLAILDKNSPR